MLYIASMISSFKVAKAFSDKNRIKILEFLSTGQKNVSQVADKLNVEENLASHHLRVLAALGFLKNDKKGREVFYKINDTRLIALIRELNKNDTFKQIFREALKS